MLVFRRSPLWLVGLALTNILVGCTTPAVLQPTASDLKPENVRTLIAKSVLRSLAFQAAVITKARVMNAWISAPVHRTGTFSGNPFTAYCVNAQIENPLFPIHKVVSASVNVMTIEGTPVAVAASRPDVTCDGTGFEAFPELERLSVKRFEQP